MAHKAAFEWCAFVPRTQLVKDFPASGHTFLRYLQLEMWQYRAKAFRLCIGAETVHGPALCALMEDIEIFTAKQSTEGADHADLQQSWT
eukprot:8004976-Lingulodinium_polyedra.AAC.1